MIAEYELTVIEDGGERRVHDVTFSLPGFVPQIGWTIVLWKALSNMVQVKRVIYHPKTERAVVLMDCMHLPDTQYNAFLEYMRLEYGAVVELVDPC